MFKSSDLRQIGCPLKYFHLCMVKTKLFVLEIQFALEFMAAKC